MCYLAEINKVKLVYANGNICAVDLNRIDGATTFGNDNLKLLHAF
jgi:hypothetical protein